MHYITPLGLQISPLTPACPQFLKNTAQHRKLTKIHTLVTATLAPLTAITHSMPPEKLEVYKSLEPWVAESILPLLKTSDKCWQPSDFLPNSSQSTDQFATEVQTLHELSANLPDDYLVVLVGNMITEDALPTYETFINTFDGVRDETAASASPWATWTRAWTAEENRHGDLLRTYLYLSGREDMLMIERTIHNLIASGMQRSRVSICGIIASDEKRHKNAYIKIVEMLLEVDTPTTMLAIADMMKKGITMPAYLMNDGQDISIQPLLNCSTTSGTMLIFWNF
ncbi:hypothetical protein L1987_85431 [Smallanthus sonchifolius]|uniref:Uncharacterized protein n=1 Tax=Smallanthus sonchifolius TaxID=185202 RepID=A0ACB8XXR1_9ASTR|nr:hypothetical protein L1987_85431 [Smallanthus sonchifolius]